MEEKLIFSRRYPSADPPEDGFTEEDFFPPSPQEKRPDPDGRKRSKKLISMAKALSEENWLDMDICRRPHEVEVRMFLPLDERLEEVPFDLAPVMRLCDELAVSLPADTPRRCALSLICKTHS